MNSNLIETAFIDSGATDHYLRSDAPKCKISHNGPPIHIKEPGGSTMTSTTQCQLQLKAVPQQARTGHVLDNIHTSLISVGKLCDAKCITICDRDKVTVHGETQQLHDTIKGIRMTDASIMMGNRDLQNGLWRVNLKEEIEHNKQMATNMQRTTSISEQMEFLHAAAGYPVLSTWVAAIKKGYYATWPGINEHNIRKHLPKSIYTTSAHIEQKRKGTKALSKIIKEDAVGEDENMTVDPPQEEHNIKTQLAFATIVDEGKIYTDQTGKFPVISNRGNRYMMVIYAYDANCILVEPMKNRTERCMLEAYEKAHERLQQAGYKPRLHWLDNEAPKS